MIGLVFFLVVLFALMAVIIRSRTDTRETIKLSSFFQKCQRYSINQNDLDAFGGYANISGKTYSKILKLVFEEVENPKTKILEANINFDVGNIFGTERVVDTHVKNITPNLQRVTSDELDQKAITEFVIRKINEAIERLFSAKVSGLNFRALDSKVYAYFPSNRSSKEAMYIVLFNLYNMKTYTTTPATAIVVKNAQGNLVITQLRMLSNKESITYESVPSTDTNASLSNIGNQSDLKWIQRDYLNQPQFNSSGVSDNDPNTQVNLNDRLKLGTMFQLDFIRQVFLFKFKY